MNVQPYLFFDGRCEEAAAFYQQAIGAEIVFKMHYNESPEPHPPGMVPPGFEGKVMHASVKVGDVSVLASDGRCEGKPDFKGFALTISTKTEAEADKLFGALSAGGQVQMPLTKTFFAPKFGMCADKFGVGWMVLVAQ